jgi:hypothetical protein
LPPEIVPTVHRGALNELGFAAEAIVDLCEPRGGEPNGTYESSFAHLAAAHGLLVEIGYTIPETPVAVEVDLVKHLWILLRVMGGQRRADIELAVDMDPAEQSAATRRVRVLEQLINAVAAEYE